VEGRVPVRDHVGRSVGNGRGHRRIAGLERVGRAWVPAAQGMKKYVWSETFVEGGKPFTGRWLTLPQERACFRIWEFALERSGLGAIRRFRSFMPMRGGSVPQGCWRCVYESLHAKVTASAGSPDIAMLSDGDLEKKTLCHSGGWREFMDTVRVPKSSDHPLDHFCHPRPLGDAAQANGIGAPEKSLEASDDGENFRLVVKLTGGSAPEHTLSFAAVTAKYFVSSSSATRRPGVGRRSGKQSCPASAGLRDRRTGASSRRTREPL